MTPGAPRSIDPADTAYVDAGGLPPDAGASGEIHAFRSSDRTMLRYRVVRATGDETWRILFLHGIESHGAWFLRAAELLSARGVTTYLLDRRGSGLNRDSIPGHAESPEELLADVCSFRTEIGPGAVHLVGLSWGGKLATAAVLDDPDRYASLSMITPGLVARVDLTSWQKLRLLGNAVIGGRGYFPIPIEPSMFTTTPKFLAYIQSDRLRLRQVTARFLLTSRALDGRIKKRLTDLHTPVLLLLAGNDRIIDNEAVRKLLFRSAADITVREWCEATHSLQFDQVDALVTTIADFIQGAKTP